jgi:hypothetical protein
VLALRGALPCGYCRAACPAHRALLVAFGLHVSVALVAKGLCFRRWQRKNGCDEGKSANAIHRHFSVEIRRRVARSLQRCTICAERVVAISTGRRRLLRSERNSVTTARNRPTMWRDGHKPRCAMHCKMAVVSGFGQELRPDTTTSIITSWPTFPCGRGSYPRPAWPPRRLRNCRALVRSVCATLAGSWRSAPPDPSAFPAPWSWTV